MAKTKSKLGRATWKGAIKLSSDSAVSIAVKAYTSILSPPKLTTIHAECESKIKQKITCPICGDIEQQDCGKAHEWHKDRLVMLSTDEITSLSRPRDALIEVDCYTDAGYLYASFAKGKTYFLIPDGAAAQEAYQTYMQALDELDSMAVTEVTITSTSPAVIYPEDGILKLSLLEYAENIKEAREYANELLALDLQPRVVKDAVALIRRNTKRNFGWSLFEDTKTRKLLAMIEKKIEAGETTTPGVGVIDLSSMFKASLEKPKAKKKTNKAKGVNRA